MVSQSKNDIRIDTETARQVDAGIRLCSEQGLHPALQFLEEGGVPRSVALRVLASPDHFRQQERRRLPRPCR